MFRKASTFVLLGVLVVPTLSGCTASASFGGSEQPTAAPPPPPPPPPPTATAPAASAPPATPAPTTTASAPPATPAPTTEKPSLEGGNRLKLPSKVEFESGSAVFKAGSDSEKALEQLRTFLVDNPRVTKLRIEGHTDNVGNAASNEKLSGDRAVAIKAWLVNKGIPKERLLAVAFGSSRPVADNSTEEGRAQNRRTEFKIAELGGKKYLNQDPTGGGKVFDL